MAGDIEAPVPQTAIDPNLNMKTRFYEGSVALTVPLRILAENPRAIHTLAIDVLFQACNEVMCLEPRLSHLTASMPR